MVYAFLAKLMMSKRFRLEPGEVILFDMPFGFVPMSCIKQMTDDAMERGSQSVSDLYFYGWVYGYTVTRRVLKSFGAKTGLQHFEDRYMVVMEIASMCGFGDFKTYEFKVGDARFKVFNNHFALQYYPADKSVDHFLRGMNAGGGALVHEMLIDCVELECISKNKEYCNFVNGSRETLQTLDQNLVNSQLDMPYLLKRQKKLIEECGDSLDESTLKITVNLSHV
jgi:hypothetical protein